MENKVKVWLSRDKSGGLWLCPSIPLRDEDGGILFCNGSITQLDSSSFPSVKCEDCEPTEAYITLANEQQEQPKHEIDWEQRRYEIVREMIVRKWLSDKIINDGQFPYSKNDDIASAIKYAYRVINKLKNESDA